jgi:hypothetical protein
LANVFVQVVHVPHGWSARTDPEGRYRIDGVRARPSDTYFFGIYPPADSGYLGAADRRQGWPGAEKVLTKNFTLHKGRVIRGRILDAGTRQPIAGASVVYQPRRGNPNNRDSYDLRNPVLSNAQGEFALTGLADKGVLLASAPGPDYVRAQGSPGFDQGLRDQFPHGRVEVDVPADKEPAPVEVLLRKGVTLAVRSTGPDGRAAPQVRLLCRELGFTEVRNWNEPPRLETGPIRVPGCDPSQTYRIFFLDAGQGLGGVADIEYDPNAAGPIEVRLQPTASVRVKIVHADGAPARDVQVTPWIWLAKAEGKVTRHTIMEGTQVAQHAGLEESFAVQKVFEKKTDPKGEIQFEKLLPGVRLYFMAATREQEVGIQSVILKPGEVRDLGTIRLEKQQP